MLCLPRRATSAVVTGIRVVAVAIYCNIVLCEFQTPQPIASLEVGVGRFPFHSQNSV